MPLRPWEFRITDIIEAINNVLDYTDKLLALGLAVSSGTSNMWPSTAKVSMVIRIKTIVIGFIIVTWCSSCIALAGNANAKLVNYIFGRYDYSFYLVIPKNILEYQYLSHYPFTAFMFLYHYDEEKIANLTVKELKSHSLGGIYSCCAGDGFYDALKFEKFKGFEDIADDLESMDVFEVAERKPDILSTLLEIYGNYKEDYKRYLKGFNGTYKFRKGNFDNPSWNKLKEYKGNVEIDEVSPKSFYGRIDVQDYDFDKKLFRIELLSPISKISSKGWEYHYLKKLKDEFIGLEYQKKAALYNLKYQKKPVLYNPDIQEEIQIPMSIEEAKKLFIDENNVFCETILTVTPEEGAFGYAGAAFFVMSSNFNIKKITKNYYKNKNWSNQEQKFVGDPVFTVELESNEDPPLD